MGSLRSPPQEAVLSLPATVTVTATGLQLPETLSDDEWFNVGHRIVRVGHAFQWWLGDWWVEGKDRVRSWGGGRETAEKIGVSYETLRNYGSVSRAFELSFRNDNLTFEHHRAAMAAPPDQRSVWLDCAEKNGWSVNQLRTEIAATKTISTKSEDKSEDKPETKPEEDRPENNKSDNAENAQAVISVTAPFPPSSESQTVISITAPPSSENPQPQFPSDLIAQSARPVHDDKPSLLQAWGQASEQDRDIICDLAIKRFFEQANGTAILNKLANGRRDLFENTLDRFATYIVNHGYPDLARIFLDAIGAKNMLMMMTPQFKAELRTHLIPNSSKALDA